MLNGEKCKKEESEGRREEMMKEGRKEEEVKRERQPNRQK